MKNTIIVSAIAVFLLAGVIWWSKSQQLNVSSEVVTRSGLHWHSELIVYVKGVKQNIPSNIGIGAAHQPMHTHDGTGAIHLEYGGRVTKGDLKLGNFFRVWGKDFLGFGSSVKMTVNGVENTSFENYEIKDGDKIELRYE